MTTISLPEARQARTISRHWIDGRWRDSASHNDSRNPATGEVLGRYAVAGEDEDGCEGWPAGRLPRVQTRRAQPRHHSEHFVQITQSPIGTQRIELCPR